MEVAPHIFGVADQIYQTMLHQKKDQVLILMGESGSGKTETMKHLIKQFVFLGKVRIHKDSILVSHLHTC